MLKPDRNLPNETLAHIFNLLSQHDLTKLALVSHRFNAQAKRVLYSSIDIADDLTENSVPKRTLGWCDAMKRNQLYDVPRKLSIRWKIYVEKSNALFRSCSLVNDNIRHLTLLDVLELSMYNENANFAMGLMIRDLRLPNLRHCSLYASNPDWHIHPFIASHPGLRYLAVLVISEPAMKLVPHDAVPELSIFYGTASEASLILPGRPVHHLLLAYGEGRGLSSKNLSRMALTSVPLRILDLAPMCISPSVLRDIAAHLPAIEILRVHLMPDWTLTGNENLSALSSCLLLLNKLNWFDLTFKVMLIGDQRSLCYDWYKVCPSLRHISLSFHGCEIKPVMWERNEAGHWFTCEPPTQESADGLYRYPPRFL